MLSRAEKSARSFGAAWLSRKTGCWRDRQDPGLGGRSRAGSPEDQALPGDHAGKVYGHALRTGRSRTGRTDSDRLDSGGPVPTEGGGAGTDSGKRRWFFARKREPAMVRKSHPSRLLN